MGLPGFTAESAVYASARVYASSSTPFGAASEHVILARINSRTDSDAGVDPDKPRGKGDPFAGYQPPPPESNFPLDVIVSFIVTALAAIGGSAYQDCKDRGGSMESQGDGTFRCVYAL